MDGARGRTRTGTPVKASSFVLQVGRNAMSGPSKALANDPNVQKVYLGL